MKEILLTVIVPCYNGGKFIERCVNSIRNQTYKNIEIIIIDDGSIDNSFSLCKNLALNDERIRVVHQNNQGSSLARKKGIDLSTGNYITFVDTDDWIHPRMYEFMIKGIINEDAEIAQCGVCNAYFKSNQQIELKNRYYSKINDKYQKYNRIESTLKILDDKEWHSYMWNKIYKRELFHDVQFPIGRFLDDDLSIMHQIFHKVNTTIYFQSEFYYYLQGSVTQERNDKSYAKKIMDRCEARWERYLFTKEHQEYSPMLNKMHNIFISVSIAGLRWAVIHPNYFPPIYISNMYNRIIESPLPINKQMNEYFSLGKKVEFFILNLSPRLHRFLIKLFF